MDFFTNQFSNKLLLLTFEISNLDLGLDLYNHFIKMNMKDIAKFRKILYEQVCPN